MAPTTELTSAKKRKRTEISSSSSSALKDIKKDTPKPSKTSSKPTFTTSSTTLELATNTLTQELILELEESIIESPRNYNHIVALVQCLQDFNDPALGITSAVSLCRTFCRLIAIGRMKKSADTPAEAKLQVWLKERYKDYVKELVELLGSGELSYQSTALTLLMKLVKEEGAHLKGTDEYFFPHDLMARIAKGILYLDSGEYATFRDEFVQKWLDEYHDVRYSFLFVALTLAEEALSKPNLPAFRTNLISILLSMKNLPLEVKDYSLSPLYVLTPSKKKKENIKPPAILSISSHRAQLSQIWLATLRLSLTSDEMKTVLGSMSHSIVPLFTKPQLLFDFLTDCYNEGGVMAILALNGLFELIKSKNLDYPNFYEKLYALFDRNLMHVRYRSRFFRLVEIFLGSTHLPANLVASFIKRMSRLTLSAPPSAIVIVVPFVYNLLKAHPTCTFMVHRERYDREEARINGYLDPFDMNEQDPMKTRAIDSCLWELVMLQGHYHPSVATLARVISEQFTKESYKVEDFLDHSYASMIDAELRKLIKKDPVVEYNIPNRIFTVAPKLLPVTEAGVENSDNINSSSDGGIAPGVVSSLTDLWAF